MAKRLSKILLIGVFLIKGVVSLNAGINIHTRFVTPRLHLLEPTVDSLTSQSAYFQMELNFSHNWSPALSLTGSVEFGPRDFMFSEQMRVKQLFLQYTRAGLGFKVGRFPYWNVLFPVRIDGLLLKVNKLGSWTVMGGYPVFFWRPTQNSPVWFVQWSPFRSMGLALWQTSIAGKNQLLTGMTAHRLWGKSLMTAGELSWNLTHQQMDRLRLYIAKRLKRSQLLLSFRKIGQTMAIYYPWLKDAITPPPLASLYWISRSPLSPSLSVGYRFSQLDSWFTTVGVGRQTKVMVGLYQHAGRQWVSGTLSTTKRWRAITLNLRLTANGVEYGGDLEPAEAFGVSAWLSWRPFANTLLQLNGGFVQNPFYQQDGRMGVDFSYEL